MRLANRKLFKLLNFDGTKLLDYLLFALMCLGHACLLMAAVNIVYSQPYHRLALKAFRASMGLLIFGGPIVFACTYGFGLLDYLRTCGDNPLRLALAFYLGLTLSIAMVVLPLITLQRNLRPRPLQMIDESTETIDVAAALGAPPFGDGETAFMAKLPFNRPFHVDFTTITLAFPHLPAGWDGLTILQLSDLHFFGTPAKEYFDYIVDRCMADGIPDLVMLTGDVVDTDTHHEWIASVLGKLRWNLGAFAILGNHDWWQDFERVRSCLRDIGMKVVSNSWDSLEVRGSKLIVAGNESPWFRPGPDLAGCPAHGFRILLSHTPDNIAWARRHHFSLMLSGHNHGGQVRLPIFGSIFVPSKYGRRYDMGTFFEPPTLLHVNRGLSGKEPLRFRCNPQVTRIVLRNAKALVEPHLTEFADRSVSVPV